MGHLELYYDTTTTVAIWLAKQTEKHAGGTTTVVHAASTTRNELHYARAIDFEGVTLLRVRAPSVANILV